jgi:hypothetical protein
MTDQYIDQSIFIRSNKQTQIAFPNIVEHLQLSRNKTYQK